MARDDDIERSVCAHEEGRERERENQEVFLQAFPATCVAIPEYQLGWRGRTRVGAMQPLASTLDLTLVARSRLLLQGED